VKKLKKASLVALVTGYLAAGINHFRVPAFYIAIIPPYLPHPQIVNQIAGCCEIGLALLLIFSKTREFAAWGIVFMLIFFIPVHIEMVRNVPCRLSGAVVSPMFAWIRLIVLQPLLILWAWWYTTTEKF
jgi:uncharacterized membrane protein